MAEGWTERGICGIHDEVILSRRMARSLMNATYVTRRRFLRHSATAGLGLAVSAGMLPFVAVGQTRETLPPLNRFPRMVQEYFVRRMRVARSRRLERLAALKTEAQARAYVEDVRAKIRESFGPMPERTPLNARITGIVERETYRIEKVIFESRPGFLVTANLYLPKGGKLPRPGVVGTCGHSNNGKAEAAYQSFSQGLVKQGYVVLIYDPIGQGERLQYTDANLRSKIGVGVREHLYAGNQQFLVGEFLGAWRAWDGMRALDYLLTRPEVDRRHLGVTGNSGGGTMTTWLCGIEPRWTMAAPSCFVTSFRRNLENELPADTEQCPPKAIALGLDHEDFLAAMAPKPVILLAKERDFFDVRGSEAAAARLKRLYRLLGAEDNIALYAGPTGHGFSRENREAMYRWFNRATGVSNEQSEPSIEIEEDETLWCTPDGQVAELDSRTVFSFTEAKAKALEQSRERSSGDNLKRAIRSVLRVDVPDRPPEYRIPRPLSGRKYPLPHATTYVIETEPGVQAIVYLLGASPHYSRPPKGRRRAILYVAHRSSDAELRNDALPARLIEAEPEAAFYSCDVRGIGESRPDTCGANSFLNPYGSDYFYAIHSIMFDDPYPGQRTRDVRRVLAWLRAQEHEEIHLAAKGWGCIPAALAALSSEAVVAVTLEGAPPSYRSIASSEYYDWPLSSLVPSVLERLDLPDVYRELKRTKRVVVGV